MFRIYTEDTGDTRADLIVAKYFQGFTRYNATGYWRGVFENSTVYEIDAEPALRAWVEDAAREIKAALEQEAVLVVEIESRSDLI